MCLKPVQPRNRDEPALDFQRTASDHESPVKRQGCRAFSAHQMCSCIHFRDLPPFAGYRFAGAVSRSTDCHHRQSWLPNASGSVPILPRVTVRTSSRLAAHPRVRTRHPAKRENMRWIVVTKLNMQPPSCAKCAKSLTGTQLSMLAAGIHRRISR